MSIRPSEQRGRTNGDAARLCADACRLVEAGCPARIAVLTAPPGMLELPLWRLALAAAALDGSDPVAALEHARTADAGEPGDWAALSAVAYAQARIGWDRRVRRDAVSLLGVEGGADRDPLLEARTLLARAAEIHPSSSLWNDIGHVAGLSGDLDGARAAFLRSLALHPADRHATINLAVLMLRAGDPHADIMDFLGRTQLAATLPPALLLLAGGETAMAGPAEVHEWRRTTVFSYAWRRELASRLRAASAEPGGGAP